MTMCHVGAMSSAMSSLSRQGYHQCLATYTLRYDGSTPSFVRAKREIVERLEARRAPLLAGLRRVHPFVVRAKRKLVERFEARR
jgi:hypothetical protein